MPVGEVTILKRIHGTAWNTLVQPYEEPADWHFKQFPTKEAVEEFALKNNLAIRQEE